MELLKAVVIIGTRVSVRSFINAGVISNMSGALFVLRWFRIWVTVFSLVCCN